MPNQGFSPVTRLRYLAGRARRIDVGSVIERAKEASTQHGKALPLVVADMLYQAGVKNVGFQDYIDYDFAILTPAERATYMTHPVSNQISQKYDHPDYRHLFQDKVEFDEVFSEHLHRQWMVVTADNADEVRAFAEKLGDEGTPTPEQVSAGATASVEAVMRLAGARVGNKTMLDSQVPFAETLDQLQTIDEIKADME